MSYILEALKKAERERGMTRVPTLTTVHDFRGMRRTQPALIAGGLALCAATLLWFFRPAANPTLDKPANPPAIAERVQEAKPSQAEQVTSASPAPALVTEVPVRPEPLHDAALPPRPAPAPSPKQDAETRHDAPVRALPDTGHAPPAPNQPTVVAEHPAPQAASPASPQSKPTPLQEAISRMTLSLLVYAEAEPDRKVYINGKKYIKGDFVDGHYLIEGITPEGAMLSYQGERALLRP